MAQLLEKIRTADNLPSLPTVALEVLRLTRDENVTLAELAEVIQNDPALTSKILKIVNCSLFGYPRKIASLRQAVIVLGLRTVKVMALSFSLVDSLHKEDAGSFDYEQFWRRSLTTAVAARLLAENCSPELRDEAFVGGLLADIGIFAAMHCAPADYAPVVRACHESQKPPQLIEQDLLGCTHAKISEILMQAWGLPDNLCRTVSCHHGEGIDQVAESSRNLAIIVRSAATLADMFCHSSTAEAVEPTVKQVCEWTEIGEAKLDVILQLLDAKVAETADLFSLDIGKVRNYLDLQREAIQQLVNLSVAAELECALAAQQAKVLTIKTEELSRQAKTDALTNIPNRASFDEQLEKALTDAATRAQAIGLIMLDVDHFKKFNDAHGHQVGDEVLRQVGRCLSQIRQPGSFPARYGGEEFAVIVLNATADAMRRMAEDIRQSIEKIRVPGSKDGVAVTASLGATLTAPAETSLSPKELVSKADQLLYKAKTEGRNRVVTSE